MTKNENDENRPTPKTESNPSTKSFSSLPFRDPTATVAYQKAIALEERVLELEKRIVELEKTA
jgi:hypothetical protein